MPYVPYEKQQGKNKLRAAVDQGVVVDLAFECDLLHNVEFQAQYIRGVITSERMLACCRCFCNLQLNILPT